MSSYIIPKTTANLKHHGVTFQVWQEESVSSGYTSWKTWALGVGMLASSDTGDGGCSGRVAAIARAKAKKERDAYAADLAHEGYTVRKFSNAGQLITRGGIGSGHPEISNVVTVYKVSYS